MMRSDRPLHEEAATATTSARDPYERLEGLVSALTRLSTRARLRRSMVSASSELSPTDAWLVRFLCDRGPARMSALATWQDVDRSTMTTQVGRLEKAGLVERGPDPKDRRAVVVCATEAGYAVYQANRAAATTLLTQILSDWTDAEREHFVAALDRFVAGVTRHVEGQDRVPPG